QFMQAGKPYPREFDRYIEDAKLMGHFDTFRDTGLTIIPEYFSAAQCDAMVTALDIADAFSGEADTYKAADLILKLNELTLSFWLDMSLVAILGKYLNRFPYARNYPNVSVANPNFDSLSTRKVNTPHDISLNVGWHFDTVNLVKFAVLLNDVDDSGSCMQVIAGTHRKHHLKLTKDDYWLSDEYVEKRKLPIVNCVGKKGTVYFFDSNAYHRLRAVKGTPRSMLKCEFTPGNNILMNCSAVADSLSEDVDALKKLTPLQRELLSGVYPMPGNGGFRYEEGTFRSDQVR
ncbi:MAG: phytanoyl-CoA dioxygenase family protein, partial [Afipia sp.]|nr:phytanoyl-CoA dioxygenase family protein [Afipia sp.]